jgi:uncharacterized iron-regulated membrane protein
MTFRQFVLVTHRWLGLAAALVLLVVGVSGALLVWPVLFHANQLKLGELHTRMFLGEPGEWLVISATVVSSILVLGGVILWWKRKLVAIQIRRGWWRFLFDLHHSLGAIAGILMLVIALTGVGLVLTEHEDGSPLSPSEKAVRQVVHGLHTGREYGRAVKVLYALGSLAFVLQGVSGFMMWWKPQVDRSDA